MSSHDTEFNFTIGIFYKSAPELEPGFKSRGAKYIIFREQDLSLLYFQNKFFWSQQNLGLSKKWWGHYPVAPVANVTHQEKSELSSKVSLHFQESSTAKNFYNATAVTCSVPKHTAKSFSTFGFLSVKFQWKRRIRRCCSKRNVRHEQVTSASPGPVQHVCTKISRAVDRPCGDHKFSLHQNWPRTRGRGRLRGVCAHHHANRPPGLIKVSLAVPSSRGKSSSATSMPGHCLGPRSTIGFTPNEGSATSLISTPSARRRRRVLVSSLRGWTSENALALKMLLSYWQYVTQTIRKSRDAKPFKNIGQLNKVHKAIGLLKCKVLLQGFRAGT